MLPLPLQVPLACRVPRHVDVRHLGERVAYSTASFNCLHHLPQGPPASSCICALLRLLLLPIPCKCVQHRVYLVCTCLKYNYIDWAIGHAPLWLQRVLLLKKNSIHFPLNFHLKLKFQNALTLFYLIPFCYTGCTLHEDRHG